MDLHRMNGPGSYQDPGEREALIWSRLPPTNLHLASGVPSLKTVCRGRETYRCAGRVVDLRPGEFLFVASRIGVSVETRAPADGLCFYSDDLREALGDAPFIKLAVSDHDMNAVRQLAGQLAAGYDRTVSTRCGWFKDLVMRAGSTAARRYRRASGVSPTTRSVLIARLERAKALLASNPRMDMRLDAVCADIGMSRYHFVRQFSQVYGLTPMRFRQKYRATRASRLLLEGRQSVEEIAHALGFFDASGFSKAFRREFGMAPGRYRVRHGVVSDSRSARLVETN